MKKIINKMLLTSIIVLSAAAVFFNIAAEKKENTGTKTIKVIWWGTQKRHDMTLKVIDMFQQKYRDIKVEPSNTSWDGFYEKLNVLISANETPDVMQQAVQNMQPYIDNNILADLNNIPTLNNKDEVSTLKQMVTKNNKLYGVCLGIIAPCLAYDREILKKAGVKAPDAKTTWADYAAMTKTINQKLKIFGSGSVAAENEFEVYIREKGESFISKDLKTVGFKESTVIDFFKMVLNMQDNGMEPIKVAIENRANAENSTYAKGLAAMRFMWTNNLVAVYKTKKIVSDITVHPGPNNENGVFIKPGTHFSIAESSKYKDEAGKFVSFFTNDIEANKILAAERGIPAFGKVRKALTAQAMFSDKPEAEQEIKINKYIDFVTTFNKKPMDGNFALAEKEVRRKYRDFSEAVMFKQISPEDAAKQLIDESNSILAR